MNRSCMLFVSALFAGTGILTVAGSQAAESPGDSPQLAGPGRYAVGTITQEFALPSRMRINAQGSTSAEVRQLKVKIWYPATVAGSSTAVRYTHVLKLPGKPGYPVAMQGIAVEAAPVMAGKRYPLVLMSHGFGGWSTQFSNLSEAIASKGYVVASIDHADMPFNSGPAFLLSFGNVLVDRAQDQRQVLVQLIENSAKNKTGYATAIDSDRIGLIGYSMGGFGALATAGAPYDSRSKTVAQLPGDARQAMLSTDSATSGRIKALVAIAPWGGQPSSRVWSADSLAKITVPVLMIAGNHDDIVDFSHGVSWIFDNLTGSDRRLLVYREARHNVAGNAFPIGPDADFSLREYLTEPVWRTERINAINAHFVTAFLDLTLKGDAAKAAWLDTPTDNAGAGTWPTGFGEQTGGNFAGPLQPKHWRGFQRRWALGLEMHHAKRGVKGAVETSAP